MFREHKMLKKNILLQSNIPLQKSWRKSPQGKLLQSILCTQQDQHD